MLAAITAVIAASFLTRAAQESRLAGRSFFQAAAFHLAEAGIEEGLFAANTGAFTSANGWALVPGTAADYTKTITSGLTFKQAAGEIYVRVDATNTVTPVVVAAGVIRISGQPPLLKQLRVGATTRRVWGNGIVVKGNVTFSGDVRIDSYDSQRGPYDAATNRSDHATVATSNTALDAMIIGSTATIYGYVATGGAAPTVGNGGRIYGCTTPAGMLVDPTRVRRDFSTNLPDVVAPAGAAIGLGSITSNLTLPRAGDLPGANGRYLYAATKLSLGGHDVLSIRGPVDLVVTGNIAMTGTSTIAVGGTGATSPSLNIYCPGTISIGGNGIANGTNVPANFTLWGTTASPGTQSLTAGGNGMFTGAIYAPNANITLNGNSGTSGAIVGKNAVIAGNSQFHYDIRLGGIPVFNALRPTSWCELTNAPGSGSAFARDNRVPFAALH